MAEHPPSDQKQRDWEFLAALERRRTQSDNLAWTVPALAIAAEAFLLTIALSPTTEPAGRLIAAVAGAIALVASAHLLAKHRVNFDLYDAHIHQTRLKLDLRPLRTKDDLLPATRRFPDEGAKHFQRYLERGLTRWLVGRRATNIWIKSLVVLILLDLLIGAYAIGEWTGWWDPGWLRPSHHKDWHGEGS
jgi:hypothetical protein